MPYFPDIMHNLIINYITWEITSIVKAEHSMHLNWDHSLLVHLHCLMLGLQPWGHPRSWVPSPWAQLILCASNRGNSRKALCPSEVCWGSPEGRWKRGHSWSPGYHRPRTEWPWIRHPMRKTKDQIHWSEQPTKSYNTDQMDDLRRKDSTNSSTHWARSNTNIPATRNNTDDKMNREQILYDNP